MSFSLDQLRNGKIFNVTFVQLNGNIRNITARLGVKKHLKNKGFSHDPVSKGNLTVYSLSDEGYRTVKIGNILRIKCNGEVYGIAP